MIGLLRNSEFVLGLGWDHGFAFLTRSVRVSEKCPSIDGRQSLKARRDITHFEEEKEEAIVATDEDDRRKPLHRHCGYFSTFEPKRESFPDTFSSRTDRYFD